MSSAGSTQVAGDANTSPLDLNKIKAEDFSKARFEKHVMISYERESGDLVRALASELAKKGLPCYFSRPGSSDVNASMAEGVESAAVIVIVQTPKYQESRKCSQEFNYADQKSLPMVSVLATEGWSPSSWLRAGAASFPSVSCWNEAQVVAASTSLCEHILAAWPQAREAKLKSQSEQKDSHVLFAGGMVTGYWRQNEHTGDMTIDFMVMKDHAVRGQGVDSVGGFTMSGTYQDKKIKFTMQYIGAHKVEYEGVVEGEEGGDLTSDGAWTIEQEGEVVARGEYQLSFKNCGKTSASGDFILLVHEAATTPLVEKIAAALRAQKLKVWFSKTGCNDPDEVMAALGRDAAVVVPVMTKLFQASQQCRDVMNYADGRGEPMVPIMAEPNWMQSGWLGVLMSGLLWVDFTKPEQFDAKMQHLLAEIKAAWSDAPYDQLVFDGSGTVEGWYEQGGKQFPVTVKWMQLKDNKISGAGKDGVGSFTITGTFAGRDFSFVKQYIGAHSVDYVGNLFMEQSLVVLRGEWSVGSYTGKFQFCIQKAEAAHVRHIMLSYQWDIQPIVKRVYDALSFHGLPLWLDIAGDMKGNINTAMADGVEKAAVFVCFSTTRYAASKNCSKELNYAHQLKHKIIPVSVDSAFKAEGWMRAIIGHLPGVVIDKEAQERQEEFDARIKTITDMIRAEWDNQPAEVEVKKDAIKNVYNGGEVTGYWLQSNTKGDMTIEYFLMQNGRVRGQGDDSVGAFTILGSYDNDGAIRFDKQYVGQHLVEYEGTYRVAPKVVEIDGEWNIGGPSCCGKFKLTCGL